MDNLEKLCRLCFKSYNNIGGKGKITKEIFDALLPKIAVFNNICVQNLGVNDGPCICTHCAENLKKCSDFKSICLSTQECLLPFCENNDNGKVDIKDLIYLNNNSREDYNVCRLCMVLIKDYSFISLSDEDLTLEKIMLQKCLPELDLSIIKDPVICTSCHESLHSYFGFMNVLEENIERHCEVTNVITEDFVQVNDLMQFTSQNILEDNENKYSLIKMEDNVDEEYQKINDIAQIKEEYKLTCEKEDEIVKIEEEIYEGQNSNESFHCGGKYFVKLEDQKFNDIAHIASNISTNQEVELKEENFMDMSNGNCLPCGNKEIDIKADFDSFQVPLDGHKMADDPSEMPDIETRPKELMKQHTLTDKSSSEDTIIKCEMCSYKTRHKRYLRRHLLIHKSVADNDMFKCEMCSYRTKFKAYLKDHLVTHKSLSEVAVFKCEMCAYKTKRRRYLRQHLLRHRSPTDVKMFKCEMCPYETNRKGNIKYHLLTHESKSLVACDICSYQTNHRFNLKQHSLHHKCSSGMFKCEMCSYKTKQKGHLKIHLLTHKSLSEGTVFKCAICAYKTKYKHNLRTHLLRHKSLSGVKTFKCEMCAFKTIYQRNLKPHLLTHKNAGLA